MAATIEAIWADTAAVRWAGEAGEDSRLPTRRAARLEMGAVGSVSGWGLSGDSKTAAAGVCRPQPTVPVDQPQDESRMQEDYAGRGAEDIC